MKSKCLTPADSSASIRFSCPCLSTVSIESPSCRDNVEDAVDTTASAPRHASSRDRRSFRSPGTRSAPMLRKCPTFSGSDVSLTNALTGFPRSASRLQIWLPKLPVAPTIKFMQDLAFMTANLDDVAYHLTRCTARQENPRSHWVLQDRTREQLEAHARRNPARSQMASACRVDERR